MRKMHLSLAGLSILAALLLAAWEFYFFWYAGQSLFGSLENSLGVFTPNRLGFNMAWFILIYLTFQLISIPFALPGSGNRFIGVLDGMVSLVPLAIVAIVIFGKPELLSTHERWEAALLLLFVNIVDLMGGYTFTIALSRRTLDVAPST
jgi:hypothetical protein